MTHIPLGNFYSRTRRNLNYLCQSSKNVLEDFKHLRSEWNSHLVTRLGHFKNLAFSSLSTIVKVVCFVASGVFETLLLPIRYPVRLYLFKRQMNQDIQAIPMIHRPEIQECFEKIYQENKIQFTPPLKEEVFKIALATYSRSQAYYAPIVYQWSKSLLETASSEGRALVFLARDGVAPYEVAKILKQKYPKFQDVPVYLKYFSRKVVDTGTNPLPAATFSERNRLFRDYLHQDTELDEESKYLFVDIGFAGSMIDPLRNEISSLKHSKFTTLESIEQHRQLLISRYKNLFGTPPPSQLSMKEMEEQIKENQFKFNFLISHTKKASGFIGSPSIPLKSIKSATQNRAVHFLEDTHHGVNSSPEKLVRDQQDRVVPVIHSCAKSNSQEFMIKSAAMLALTDYSSKRTRRRDAYKETRSLEKSELISKIEKCSSRPSLCNDSLLSKTISYVKEQNLKKISLSDLKSCLKLINKRVNKLSLKEGSTISLVTKNLITSITNELSQRENTFYHPNLIVSNHKRNLFDQFLKSVFNGENYLYLEHLTN